MKSGVTIPTLKIKLKEKNMMFDEIFKRLEKLERELMGEYQRVFDDCRKEILGLKTNEDDKKLPCGEKTCNPPSVTSCDECTKNKDKHGVSVSIHDNDIAHEGRPSTCNSGACTIKKNIKLNDVDPTRCDFDDCNPKCIQKLGHHPYRNDVEKKKELDLLPRGWRSRHHAMLERLRARRRAALRRAHDEELPDDKRDLTVRNYSDLAEEIIDKLPGDKNTSDNRAVLRAYLVLAVLLNRTEISGFIQAYKEVFDLYNPTEFGVPTMEDHILNNYKLYNAFMKLQTKIHEDDEQWVSRYSSEESWESGGKIKVVYRVNFCGKKIELRGNGTSFYVEFDDPDRVIDIKTATTEQVLNDILRAVKG